MPDEERAENQSGGYQAPPPRSDSADTGAATDVKKIEDDSTVGTGSAIALGCIAATLVLIVIGLALLAVFALIR